MNVCRNEYKSASNAAYLVHANGRSLLIPWTRSVSSACTPQLCGSSASRPLPSTGTVCVAPFARDLTQSRERGPMERAASLPPPPRVWRKQAQSERWEREREAGSRRLPSFGWSQPQVAAPLLRTCAKPFVSPPPGPLIDEPLQAGPICPSLRLPSLSLPSLRKQAPSAQCKHDPPLKCAHLAERKPIDLNRRQRHR